MMVERIACHTIEHKLLNSVYGDIKSVIESSLLMGENPTMKWTYRNVNSINDWYINQNERRDSCQG